MNLALKKKFLSPISALLTIILCFSVLPFSQNVSANQSRSGYFAGGYTLSGIGASDMVAIGNKQIGRTKSQFGYTEGWCDNFISDCAILCRQSKAVPQGGDVNDFLSKLKNAGATKVTTPRAGDIAIFYSGSSAAHAALMINGSDCLNGNYGTATGASRVVKYTYSQVMSYDGWSSVAFYRPAYSSSFTSKVTFNSNDGTGRTVTETFTTGVTGERFGYNTDGTGKYSIMNDPSVGFGTWTRSGYKLLGWSTDSTASAATYSTYSAVTDNYKMTHATVTLYAVWERDTTPSVTITPIPTITDTPTPTPLTGWQKEDGKWCYYNDSGIKVTGWQKIDSKWYFFTDSGVMKTGWLSDGGKWYYLASSGAMLKGWQQIGGTWYYFDGLGAMVTGWKSINNFWYYFKSSGAMVTGWIKIGGSWYYFETSGAMKTGWLQIGPTWYYFESSGAMATNKWIGNYYVDASGAWTQTR